MQGTSKAGWLRRPCDKRPVVVGKWRIGEAGLRTCYPPRTVSYFHREAKAQGVAITGLPLNTDDEGRDSEAK